MSICKYLVHNRSGEIFNVIKEIDNTNSLPQDGYSYKHILDDNDDIIIWDVAKEYSVRLHDMTFKKDYWIELNGEDSYYNIASVAGNEIFLGEFDNKEVRLFAFFHEMGHILDSGKIPSWEEWSYYHWNEASAWRTGINLAKTYGLKFSKESYKYAKNSLSSYFVKNPLNGEKSDIKHLPDAIGYAFG